MARPLRIEFDGAWYHVMNRGSGRKNIFLSDKDRSTFLEILGETSETFKIEIHAYSLMDNHYHLLIHTPQSGLSRAMRHINGVYTQKFNWHHRTDGPLFRGRYRALLVDSDEYLLQLVRYIHLNPVEAGLCENPLNHKWTSHGSYHHEKTRPSWLVREEVLSRFGSHETQALKEMHRFVYEEAGDDFESLLKKHPVILGRKVFQEWVYQNYGDPKLLKSKEIVKNQKSAGKKITPGELMKQIAFAYGVEVKDLRTSQRGQLNEARNVGVYLMRRLMGLPIEQIAKWFNCPSGYTVATIQKRVKDDLERNKRLRKMVGAVAKTLQA